jgi:hypothetical protein
MLASVLSPNVSKSFVLKKKKEEINGFLTTKIKSAKSQM